MEKKKAQAIEAKLVHKKQLTNDVIELHFESSPPFHFEPGQFFSIIVPGRGPGGRDLRRAYSIASHPENHLMELCVKVVEGGPGTQYLNNLKIGDVVKGMAPYGDFIFKTHHAKHVIFIATGTGIAPFRSMISSQVYKEHTPLSTTMLFGARDTGDLIYTQDFVEKLGADRMVQALSRPAGEWKGMKGRVTDWLRQNEDKIDWLETEFYLCGNGAMIDEVKLILGAHHVGKPSIHQEVYYKPKAGEAHASQDDE